MRVPPDELVVRADGHADPGAVAGVVLAAQLRALTTVLDTVSGRRRFVETLRRRLPDPAGVADDDPLPAALVCGDTEELFAAVGEVSWLMLARQLIDITSYYEM